MNSTEGTTGQQQLHYFGQVTASVSHELKNVLAILSEHAGLLQDLAGMAQAGQGVDAERSRRLAAGMLRQIGRGDEIIRRMNRFAHSVDRERAVVDLGGLASLVVELFGRSAATRGITVEVHGGGHAVSPVTCPFMLQTLLGGLLDRLSALLPQGGTVRVEVVDQAPAAQLRLVATGVQPGDAAGLLESDTVQALLAALQARAVFGEDSGALLITLPGDIDAADGAEHRA